MNFFKGLVDVILSEDPSSLKVLKSQAKNSDACLRLLRKYGVGTVSNLSNILTQNQEALEQLTKQIEIDNDTISQLSQTLKVKEGIEQDLLDSKNKIAELEAKCDELKAVDKINRANITKLTKELLYYKEMVESKSDTISLLAIKLYQKNTLKDKTLENELAFAKANIADLQEKLVKLAAPESNNSKGGVQANSENIHPDTIQSKDRRGDFTGNIKDVLGDISEMSTNIFSLSTKKTQSSSIGDNETVNDHNYQSLLNREARAIMLAERLALELLNNTCRESEVSLLHSQAEMIMNKLISNLTAQVDTIRFQMEAEREKYNEVAKLNEELRATCTELKKMVNMAKDEIKFPPHNNIEIVYINALDIVQLDLPPEFIDPRTIETNFIETKVSKIKSFDTSTSYHTKAIPQPEASQKIDDWDDEDEDWEENTPKPPTSNNPVHAKPSGKSNVWDEDLDCFDDV